MSGICGVIHLDGAPVEPEILKEMAKAAAHRGPDGIRYWTDDNAGLAHLALNITPGSLREQQPLVSRGNDLVLTANARIDNRGELIRALGAKGYLPEAEPTDGELILAAYRCWGEECPARLVGDFAFAIWDAGRKRLFAARDANGMRAFYYRSESRRVLFGTEVKQILAAPNVPVRWFEPAICAYLASCYGPPEWSFYDGICQLPPAYALVADKRGHRTWRYWDIDPDYRIEYSSEDEYVEHFLDIFKEAVRCRLRSVKPVFISLSGGVDSGSVASTAGWLLQRDSEGSLPGFHTYCYAFEDCFEELAQCDERHISTGIANHYDLPVTDIPADTSWPLKDYPAHSPDRDDPVELFARVLWDQVLATARAEGMGLGMSGGYGDRMVGGLGQEETDTLGLLQAGRLRALWSELRALSHRHNVSTGWIVMSQLLWNLSPQGTKWALDKSRKMWGYKPYPDWVRSDFAERVGLDEILRYHEEPRPNLRSLSRRERYKAIFDFRQGRVNVTTDRMFARFGLGYADPWSDRRLASFVLATPQWRIQRVQTRKRIARQAMRGIMPEQVRREMGKTSLFPLYKQAFREQQGKDTALSLSRGSVAAAVGYIDEDIFRRHLHDQVQQILSGKKPSASGEIWKTLAVEMWFRQHWT